MTFRYTISEEDYLRFNLYFNEHSQSQRSALLRARLLLPFLMLLLALIANNILQHARVARIVVLCVFAAAAVVLPLLYPRYFRKRSIAVARDAAQRMGGLLTADRVLALTDARIEDLHADRSAAYAYTCVERIALDGGAVYIFVDPLSAIIVPARAFLDAPQQRAFVDLLIARTGKMPEGAAPIGAIHNEHTY